MKKLQFITPSFNPYLAALHHYGCVAEGTHVSITVHYQELRVDVPYWENGKPMTYSGMATSEQIKEMFDAIHYLQSGGEIKL